MWLPVAGDGLRGGIPRLERLRDAEQGRHVFFSVSPEYPCALLAFTMATVSSLAARFGCYMARLS
jgi:hypothetical protein